MDYIWIMQIPMLLFSIIAHEYSHAAVADYFGDDTARLMGRLTFNPLPHLDIFGSVLLPAFCLLTGSPLFGWAKPVPVNEFRLRDRRKAGLWVAAAGPLTNFTLAVICAAFLWLLSAAVVVMAPSALLMRFLQYGLLINLYLCVFNLLPIPPLDGSRVLERFLPHSMERGYAALAPHGFVIILLLMVTGLFGRIVTPVVSWLYYLLTMGIR